jgi:hypothetical protein
MNSNTKKQTLTNVLTPENNIVAYNFYAVSELIENIYTCSNLILQYDGENIEIPLSLKEDSVGYFRALWTNNTVVDANLETVGSWTIQFNPNATILKIKDNGIPNNPEATIFLPLYSNDDKTYNIGTNTQGNLQNSQNELLSYQVQFYQPQNIVSEKKKYNSLYIPFIATSTTKSQGQPELDEEQQQNQEQEQQQENQQEQTVNVFC